MKGALQITLYTDASVYLITGEASYGLICVGAEMEVAIRAKLLQVDPKGATKAEHLSVVLGFKLLLEAGLSNKQIVVVNGNTKTIQTVNSEESFKEVVGGHGGSKHKLWKQKEQLEDVSRD